MFFGSILKKCISKQNQKKFHHKFKIFHYLFNVFHHIFKSYQHIISQIIFNKSETAPHTAFEK